MYTKLRKECLFSGAVPSKSAWQVQAEGFPGCSAPGLAAGQRRREHEVAVVWQDLQAAVLQAKEVLRHHGVKQESSESQQAKLEHLQKDGTRATCSHLHE